MLGGARYGKQQVNIGKNKSKPVVELAFAEEEIFYRLLSKHVDDGRRIRITFVHSQAEKDSKLWKMISPCQGATDLEEQLVDLAGEGVDVWIAYVTKNIKKLIKANQRLQNRVAFQAYEVEFDFNEDIGYFMKLSPIGEGENDELRYAVLM